jgi:molybdopterin molybdotransferase
VSEVVCAARPRVSILSTGTELRQPGETLQPGEIYESNGIMLQAVIEAAGGVVTRASPVADDHAAHREALERALDADVVITTGGVSVGPHDLVREVGADLGVREVFWRVAMRPGKPLSFAVKGDTLVFGLPGNPVSSLVGALLFVVTAVLALQGATDVGPRWHPAALAAAVPRNQHRDDFVRAVATAAGDGVRVAPIGGQDSHMIVRAASANALVHIPRGEGVMAAGAAVRYLRLD